MPVTEPVFAGDTEDQPRTNSSGYSPGPPLLGQRNSHPYGGESCNGYVGGGGSMFTTPMPQSYAYPPQILPTHPPPHFRASDDSTQHGARDLRPVPGHEYSAFFPGQGHGYGLSMYSPPRNMPQNQAMPPSVQFPMPQQHVPQHVGPHDHADDPPQTNDEPVTKAQPRQAQPPVTSAQARQAKELAKQLRVVKEQARLASDLVPSQGVKKRRDEEAPKVSRQRPPLKPAATKKTTNCVTKGAVQTSVKAEDISSDEEEPLFRNKPLRRAGRRKIVKGVDTSSDDEVPIINKQKKSEPPAPQKDVVKNRSRVKAGTTDEDGLDAPLLSPADPSKKVKPSPGTVPAAVATASKLLKKSLDPAAVASASKHSKKSNPSDACTKSTAAAAAASPSGGGTDGHKGGRLRVVREELLSPWTESVIAMNPDDKHFREGAIAAGQLCHNFASKCCAI